jgi:CheY-like chemotaxis protein
MSRTVLIVEDDDVIRESLKELLEMEAYHVDQARHGKEAIELLRARSNSALALPFLILLDLNMPVMPGREFLEALQKEETHISNIPVLVMTAAPLTGGPNPYGVLKKPIDLDELLDKIRTFNHDA